MTSRKLHGTRHYVRQNVTVSFDNETVRKAKILAVRRGTSISALLGERSNRGRVFGLVYRRRSGRPYCGFRIEDGAKLSFWDAVIVASAVRGGASRLLTEDLNAGQIVSGVRIENPFATSCGA